MAVERDWEIHQIDVKSAYPASSAKGNHIHEGPPRGVLKPGQEGKVCRLLKGALWTQTGRTRVVPGAHQSYGARARL